jgi:hypothetical protein
MIPQRYIEEWRAVAPWTIDAPMYRKIERYDRRAKQKQVFLLAGLLQADPTELLTLWVTDRVVIAVADEKEFANKALDIAKNIISQERYKNILSTLIVAKDSAFINSLPQKLLKLAVSSFKRDNSNDYADNFDFLSIIMQHGNNNQKGYVVVILTTKLDKNVDIEKILGLIETMNNVASFDSSGLLYSHLDKYQKDYNDNINPVIAEKIKVLKKQTKIN